MSIQSELEELYNRRHAGARNVIERTFGVIQARFRILTTGCHFDTQTQADLFPALAVVHNLVRRLDPDSDIDVSENVVFTNDAVDDVVPPPASKAVTKKAASARDRVARRMWKKYERN
ncbi:unnamed protein product [Tilletia caries]|nr:hypothetical protein CF336_g8288 [Tilletia laevis]CAD6957640.1 unnamed protein product [Tilletia caries]